MSFPVREFLKGDVIFKEDAKGDAAYLLKSGMVDITTMDNGRDVVLATLKPVSVFGEMALLLDGHRRTASAVVSEDALIVEINRRSFDDFIKKSPLLVSSLLTVLVQRLQKANELAKRVPDPFDGVCNILALFTWRSGMTVSYDWFAKHAAKALLVEEESVYRVLSMLNQTGVIDVERMQPAGKVLYIEDRENFMIMAKRIKDSYKAMQEL